MFGSAATGNASQNNGQKQRPNAENVFADVFDEVGVQFEEHLLGHRLNLAKLLRPEVARHTPWWSYLGAACGGGEPAPYKI